MYLFILYSRFTFSLFLLTILALVKGSSLIDSSNNVHANNQQPHQSFVGKIVPDKEDEMSPAKENNKGEARNNKVTSQSGRAMKKNKDKVSAKTQYHKAKAMGRSITIGKPIAKEEKPNWYYSDPEKFLGQAILAYEPEDPNEPDPSIRIRQTPLSGRGPPKGSGRNESSITNPGKTKGKGTGGGKQKKIVEFPPSAELQPDAPGWFALKTNVQFGKKLKLGVLLRKKGRSNDSNDPNDVGDSRDGNNLGAVDMLSLANRKYDKNCLWLEYKDIKAATIAPKVSEEIRQIVSSQNRHLADFFLDLTFNIDIDSFQNHRLAKQEPTRGFELLGLTKKIFFEQICKDKEFDEVAAATNYTPLTDRLLPKQFLEGIYQLFLKLHELTSPTETSDYLDASEATWITNYLTQCNQTKGRSKKILWYTDECKEQVLAFDKENNFACTPYPEFDFNIKKYDPILDTIWHMISSVQSHCFESFQTNIRMWHRYALAMASLFPTQMRVRWSSSEDNKKFYTRLFGPNYETYFDNMNRCMYAANLRSDVPYLQPRFEGDRLTKFAPKRYHKI